MKEGIKRFIETANVYEVHNVFSLEPALVNEIISPHYFDELTFDYHCSRENNKLTSFILSFSNRIEIKALFERISNGVPQAYLSHGMLDYTIHLTGKCQSCNDYHVDFLINIFSEEAIPSSYIGVSHRFAGAPEQKLGIPISMRKVGVKPELKVALNPLLLKFFDRESANWYHKGVKAIADNYGIGSLAYFRRIVEKELLHIIKEIKELPDSHGLEIQKLLDEHVQNGTVSSIYENIFHHLPNSLKVLGDNPIKLLYNQTSEGLHSMTEGEALKKAQAIQRLLDFVIIKINEERSDIRNLKEVIKGLKG